MRTLFVILLVLSWASVASPVRAAESGSTSDAVHVETIVAIRHGETPSNDLGQLSCRGLNRALALPKLLTARYGTPNFIFAPNPAMKMHSPYSYVRALATIEPTAISLTMPVNTQIGRYDFPLLQQVLTSPDYEDSLIFMAWEHGDLHQFAKNLVKAYGGDPSTVPDWPGNDFDSVFVIRLTRRGCKTSVSFEHQHENLTGHLRDTCPGF